MNPKDTINGTILYDAASKIAYKGWQQQHFYLKMDNNNNNNDNDAEDCSMITIGSSSSSIHRKNIRVAWYWNLRFF